MIVTLQGLPGPVKQHFGICMIVIIIISAGFVIQIDGPSMQIKEQESISWLNFLVIL